MSRSSGHVTLPGLGRLAYYWDGPEDGQVVVMIHGLTTPSFVWRELMPHLTSAGFRVLSFDHFGRGGSDRPRVRYDYDLYVREIDGLLDALDLRDPVDIFGYSMGGGIAPVYGARRSDRVQRIIALAPAGFAAELGGFFRIARDWGLLGDLLNALFGGYVWRRGAEQAGRAEGAAPDLIAMQQAETRTPGFKHAVLSSIRSLIHTDLVDVHRQIHDLGVPLLSIWGDADTVIPLAGKEALSRANPDAEIVVIKEAQHGLAYTHARDVAAHAIRFLNKPGRK